MKKKSNVYSLIIGFWTICNCLIIASVLTSSAMLFIRQTDLKLYNKILIVIILWINSIILSYFWLNSIKDFIYSLIFIIRKKSILKKYDPIVKSVLTEEFKNKKVVFLYCTCNDFDPSALKKSMFQDYINYEIVILDDSTKLEYISKIDEFSKKHNIKVIRRKNREGFKAGNLNNYLKNNDYDYFVVLDSDEILPNNFISESLKYFQYDQNIGVVQAVHLAAKPNNFYQYLLGLSIDSNSLVIQVMKNFYGSNSLLGHGMMISKECYKKTNGFPHIVAEDIAFAIEVKDAGYKIAYAFNIFCKEEFPNDYISLKKRQCKWTQGNVEYMKKYSKDIKKSSYKWYEKLDIKLSHYSLPIIPVLSLILIINASLLGFLEYRINPYRIALLSMSLLFLISPVIPNFFVYAKSKKIFFVIPFFIASIINYTSLTPMMIRTVILSLFNKKAVFLITPKDKNKIPLRYVILHSIEPLIFSFCVSLLIYFSWGTVVPTLIITVPLALTPFIIVLANFKMNDKKEKLSKTKRSF